MTWPVAACALACGLAAVLFSPDAAAQKPGDPGAKDLFFGDERPLLVQEKGFRPAPMPQGGASAAAAQTPATPATPAAPAAKPAAAAKPTNPGLRVWLTDANDASGSKRLSPQQVFRTGDRVKLSLQSNRDGYLYVVNVGTSGQTRMIFPRNNQDNRVQRYKDFAFNSPLVFSEPAGTEQLVLVLSAAPIDDASVELAGGSMQKVTLRGNGSLATPAAGGQQAARQPGNSGRDAASASLDLALADLKGSKDLKFDDDGAELVAVSRKSDERPGSFAPVVVNLRLTHRR